MILHMILTNTAVSIMIMICYQSHCNLTTILSRFVSLAPFFMSSMLLLIIIAIWWGELHLALSYATRFYAALYPTIVLYT